MTAFVQGVGTAGSLIGVARALKPHGRAHLRFLVRWRTASEFDTLGFHIYRQRGQRRVRVNRRLIASLGSVSGGSYSFLDRRAPRRSVVRYWLQEIELDGSRSWHGPVRVRRTWETRRADGRSSARSSRHLHVDHRRSPPGCGPLQTGCEVRRVRVTICSSRSRSAR